MKTPINGVLSGLRQFLANESPLKMMKNAFYFTLKVLFVLKIFKVLSWVLGDSEKRLDHKDNVNFKAYDVTTWETNNWKTLLPNISISKGNQTMKFGQLIEYNLRNIFLGKSYRKCGEETISRAFTKKSKLSVSLDQQSKDLQDLHSLFLL